MVDNGLHLLITTCMRARRNYTAPQRFCTTFSVRQCRRSIVVVVMTTTLWMPICSRYTIRRQYTVEIPYNFVDAKIQSKYHTTLCLPISGIPQSLANGKNSRIWLAFISLSGYWLFAHALSRAVHVSYMMHRRDGGSSGRRYRGPSSEATTPGRENVFAVMEDYILHGFTWTKQERCALRTA